MGLFSAHGRLPQPARPKSTTRLAWQESRLALAIRAAVANTGKELAAGLREARLAAIAATNDAWIVAVLLLLAAVALGLEMAASFRVI
jgi:hypothetical protein